jgi:hypothetical protein
LVEVIVKQLTFKEQYKILLPLTFKMEGLCGSVVRGKRPELITEVKNFIDANIGVLDGFEDMTNLLSSCDIVLRAGEPDTSHFYREYESTTVKQAILVIENPASPMCQAMIGKGGKVLKSDAERAFRTGAQDNIGYSLVNNIVLKAADLNLAEGIFEAYHQYGFEEAYRVHASQSPAVMEIGTLRSKLSFVDTSAQAVNQAMEGWSKIALEHKRGDCQQLLEKMSLCMHVWEADMVKVVLPTLLIKLKQADMEFVDVSLPLRQTPCIQELLALTKQYGDLYKDSPPFFTIVHAWWMGGN